MNLLGGLGFAAATKATWALGLGGGIVVANPIPEAFELSRERLDAATEQALGEAHARGVIGKALTPFLLARINALTGGDSLRSNIALVLDNARLGARIAVAYAA
jgi:pseudouridine-5'-phosphate glycosidase